VSSWKRYRFGIANPDETQPPATRGGMCALRVGGEDFCPTGAVFAVT
jgi:hypothetical protein